MMTFSGNPKLGLIGPNIVNLTRKVESVKKCFLRFLNFTHSGAAKTGERVASSGVMRGEGTPLKPCQIRLILPSGITIAGNYPEDYP